VFQSASGGGTNPSAASWNRRSKAAVDANVSSDCAQAGKGGTGTSPAMKLSRSRPSESIANGSGTPSNPRSRTYRNSAWIAVALAGAGFSTWSPRRTTAPALATPPASNSSIRPSVR
jgi:hypothetical protein